MLRDRNRLGYRRLRRRVGLLCTTASSTSSSGGVQEQELLPAIWDALNVGRDSKALVIARQGIVININSLASQLFGRSLGELVGRSIGVELFDGPSTQLSGTTGERWETVLKAASGSLVPVEVTRQSLGDRLPEIEVYAVRDLRGRQEAVEERERQRRQLRQREEELRTQNEKFDAALENMLQGLAMFDAEQRLIVCNKRYAEMYGRTPEQVRPGTTVRQIFDYRLANGFYHVKDTDSFVGSWTTGFGAVSSRIQELADGRIISVSRHQMANGGRLVTHEDITERQKLSSKLAEQNELLKSREQELQAHEKRLRAQNRAARCGAEQYVPGVVHDGWRPPARHLQSALR